MENTPPVPQTNDIEKLAMTIGAVMNPLVGAQADAARANAQASVEVAQLNTRVQILHLWQSFALRIGCGVIVSGVIVGGFVTGRMEIVTHALAAVAGLVAGYGARAASR